MTHLCYYCYIELSNPIYIGIWIEGRPVCLCVNHYQWFLTTNIGECNIEIGAEND